MQEKPEAESERSRLSKTGRKSKAEKGILSPPPENKSGRFEYLILI